MRTLTTLALLLVPILPAAATRAQIIRHETSPQELPIDSRWDAEVRRGTVITRVVDADRGRSVAGAVVLLVREVDQPLGGPPEPAARFVADEDGLVTIIVDEETPPWNWLIADAPGYAPLGIYSYPDEEIRLRRGERRAVRFVDPRLRPLKGLELECIVGCGHTPTVRRGRADVAGVVEMEDVSDRSDGILEYWVRHPSVAPEYVNIPETWSEGVPPTLVLPFGRELSGVVRDADGRPRADVRVGGCAGAHRGPWAASDAEGRFRLMGIPLGTREVEVVVPERLVPGTDTWTEETSRFVTLPPTGVPLALRIGPDGRVEKGLVMRQVEVTLEDDQGSVLPGPGIEAVLWRREDGRSVRGRSGASGRIALPYESGDDWMLQLSDPGLAFRPRTLPIVAGEPAITVRLEARPTRVVELRTPIGRYPAALSLLVGDRAHEMKDCFEFVAERVEGEDQPHDLYRARLPIVEEGNPVLSLTWEGGYEISPTLVPFEPSTEPLIIRPPALRRFRVVASRAPDGSAVGFDASIVDLRDEGIVDLDALASDDEDDEDTPGAPRTFALGDGETRRLCFLPDQTDLEPIVMPSSLSGCPRGADGVPELSLDFVALPPPLLRVFEADGSESIGAYVELTPDHSVELEESGSWSPPTVIASRWRGRTARIWPPAPDPEHRIPMTVEIPSSGTLDARWPAGSVVLRMPAGEDGVGRWLDVIVDGGNLMHLEAEAESAEGDARVHVRGLSPGRHRLLVGRRGFLTERIEFELGEGAKELEIDLLARRP
ncbi:MAG: carboxypeptidase-like regulatory domain-containing protein [Planctomycetota bacterium]